MGILKIWYGLKFRSMMSFEWFFMLGTCIIEVYEKLGAEYINHLIEIELRVRESPCSSFRNSSRTLDR